MMVHDKAISHWNNCVEEGVIKDVVQHKNHTVKQHPLKRLLTDYKYLELD